MIKPLLIKGIRQGCRPTTITDVIFLRTYSLGKPGIYIKHSIKYQPLIALVSFGLSSIINFFFSITATNRKQIRHLCIFVGISMPTASHCRK